MSETATAQPVIEHTLFAEPLGHLGNFPITNSLLNSWLVVILVLVLGLFIKKNLKAVPRGLQNGLEAVIEMFLNLFDGVTGSRAKSLKFAPLVLALFFFILLNNWLGILPGIGSIGQIVSQGGRQVFVPYFRGGTADLNTTLALAIIGVVASHIFGVVSVGIWRHFNKFINLKALLEIPKKIRHDPTIIFVNPIKVFVGLIEIIGEAAKVASLSFRLFGNIFAGEVLLASMSALLAWGVPIPFMFLEIIVGLIQALIFAMLVLVYLSIHSTVEEH
jgi:F-type H+-transporting ATPase subunit a